MVEVIGDREPRVVLERVEVPHADKGKLPGASNEGAVRKESMAKVDEHAEEQKTDSGSESQQSGSSTGGSNSDSSRSSASSDSNDSSDSETEVDVVEVTDDEGQTDTHKLSHSRLLRAWILPRLWQRRSSRSLHHLVRAKMFDNP